MDFAIPVDLGIKIKESKKRDEYSKLARKLRKLLNVRVTVIPIISGALGTSPQRLGKGTVRV